MGQRMIFNVDNDPINRNWIHWKTWNVPCSTLGELMEFLGIMGKPENEQARTLHRLEAFYKKAPEILRDEVRAFLETHLDGSSR